MGIDEQKYYWLFSSSSQTIAAFVAFLVTGFAVVLNMMDSLQQKDETLAEIHHQIKTDYYKKIFFLALISGMAIICSLSMVYINGIKLPYKNLLFIITAALNTSAIGLAIFFIVNIINPNKYQIAAKEIIDEDKSEFAPHNNDVSRIYFMNEFAELEKKVRKILKRMNIIVDEDAERKGSFRQLVTALVDNELISKEDLYELLQINKYRNLVFHGELETVNRSMLDRIKNVSSSIDKILDSTLQTYLKQ
jgi:hypothetical protein